jgi:magnesium-transporting ATPase (P-type)
MIKFNKQTFVATWAMYNKTPVKVKAMKSSIRFTTILFAAITLSTLMTHLLELRVKINLSKEDYQTVQRIYTGWQWLEIFEIGTILLILMWTIIYRKVKSIYPLLLLACICFIISLAIFFLFTFPANQATHNWTNLPAHWNELRSTWEYSNVVRALLSLIGFSILIATLLKRRKKITQ